MLLHVYRVTGTCSAIPITILAEYEEHAIELYDVWAQTHFPDKFDVEDYPGVNELDERELEDNPQLAKLIEDSAPGIAYWFNHIEGWHTGKPEGPMLGRLAPPDTPVRYYAFESGDQDDDLAVFAHSSEEALLIFYAYCDAKLGRRPARVNFLEVSRFTIVGAMPSVLDDMDAGLTGVAGYSKKQLAWRIYQPDHELAGLEA